MLSQSLLSFAAVGAGIFSTAYAIPTAPIAPGVPMETTPSVIQPTPPAVQPPVAPVEPPVAPVEPPVAPVEPPVQPPAQPTPDSCGQGPVTEAPTVPGEGMPEDIPVNWGVLAMPGADLLDVFGPLEVLYFVAGKSYLNLTIITPTEENVVLDPPMGNKFNSIYAPTYVGSATMKDNLDLDVLLIPGGAAARDPSLLYIDDWVAEMYPKVKYLVTICTGAIFPARAGVFDNRRVTTNKKAWETVTKHGNNVTWVAPARYVVDGNIWSSSGVTAGIDLMLHWVKTWYGEELHDLIAHASEIEPRAHDDDPFTDMFNIPHSGQI
ncbi:DJ-1 family [Paramyrothecium foliicola]|nr:DJ-1 family [Paramyrothecium foliicola]